MHINCLELLAATLAVKTGMMVLLQLNNQTIVAYINDMGGTVSPQLTDLAKALWMWALAKDIILTAEYIPGVTNVVADAESRSIRTGQTGSFTPANQPEVGEFVCILPVHPTTSLFQLETRPTGRGNRYIQPTMGDTQGLCEFRVESCLRCSKKRAQVILVAPVWKGQPL